MTDAKSFAEKVGKHETKLRERGYPVAAEMGGASGQAALWFGDVRRYMPRTARDVGRQLARLCRDDSLVTTTWRSLTSAVGQHDKAGRDRAYTEVGAKFLVGGGWLRVETVGKGPKARTTFYLMPGDQVPIQQQAEGWQNAA